MPAFTGIQVCLGRGHAAGLEEQEHFLVDHEKRVSGKRWKGRAWREEESCVDAGLMNLREEHVSRDFSPFAGRPNEAGMIPKCWI